MEGDSGRGWMGHEKCALCVCAWRRRADLIVGRERVHAADKLGKARAVVDVCRPVPIERGKIGAAGDNAAVGRSREREWHSRERIVVHAVGVHASRYRHPAVSGEGR